MFRQLIRSCMPVRLRAWILGHVAPRRVFGITRALPDVVKDSATTRPRVLVSYLVGPFVLPPNDPEHIRFSNLGIARALVQALNDLGYAVDVVDYIDRRFRPAAEYAAFVGHGTHNFRPIAEALPPRTPKLFLASTNYWRFHNAQAAGRAQDLARRRQFELPPDRPLDPAEEWNVLNADAVVGFGNGNFRDKFPPAVAVRSLNIAAYPATNAPAAGENDFGAARRNFLFFAGAGNVHKGLDLLLEAFARPGVDAHLWVCQEIGPEFDRAYHRELHETPGVHLEGYVPMRGPRFRELAARCAYVILPSCSEGCPGSVVECMHHGLIPVVSRECNLDTGEYGVTLAECTPDSLAAAVGDLSTLAPDRCREMSRDTLAAASRDFSADAFLTRVRSILEELLARPTPASPSANAAS